MFSIVAPLVGKESVFENFSIELPENSMSQRPPESIFIRMKDALLGVKVQKCERKVYVNGFVDPINKQTNTIKNSKYTVISFLPLVLYEQFHQFINLFYLGLTITQFIDILKVGK